MEGVRRRGTAGGRYEEEAESGDGDDEDREFVSRSIRRDASPRLNVWAWLALFLYIWLVIWTSKHLSSSLPAPWPSSEHGDTRDLSRFSEDRAVKHLLVLTSFRPRTVGTEGNDRFAARYIVKEAEAIAKKALPVHKMQIDHQIVSGSFRLAFLGGFNSVYHDVHNVLVRIGPVEKESNRTLMINCHFDSAIGVDGASDDLSQCVTMLEVLTVLSQRGTLPCNVLFLFNGAEESILQGSHGFVTQHPWAKEVTAFINLEAAGSGGRDVLFQTGPKHPWLVRAYNRVPYPTGNSMGEEIFQSGVIPSDTDFRIFRDHGGLPGVDIAYVENGYVYHTEHDRVEQIRPGSLQRAGENLLALVYAIGTSPEFHDLGNCADCALDSAVYFDFVGVFFVQYSHRTGVVVNTTMSVCALLAILLELKRDLWETEEKMPRKRLMLLGLIGAVVSLIVPVGVSGAVGWLTSRLAPMAWYSRPELAVTLYAAPALSTVFLIHSYLFSHPSLRLVRRLVRESVVYCSVALLWILALTAMTGKGLNSAFAILFFVLTPIPIRFMWLHMQPAIRKEALAFVTMHLVAVFVPTVGGLYALMSLVQVFIPIFGRTGSELNPDLALAVIVAFITVSVGSYYSSLMQLTEGGTCRWLCAGGFAVCGLTIVAISLTPLGFPYSGPPGSLCPKRLAMQHFHRETFALNGSRRSEENGLWMVPLDYLGLEPIDIPALLAPSHHNCHVEEAKQELLYFGLPFIYPMMELLKHHRVIKLTEQDRPPIAYHPLLRKLDDQLVPLDQERSSKFVRHRLTFSVQLVDHSNIYVSPVERCSLVGWNVTSERPMSGPRSRKQSSYFVFLVAGYDAKRPVLEKVFYLDIMCERPSQQTAKEDLSLTASAVVEIGVVNHFLASSSPLMDSMLEPMPTWVSPIHWINSLHLHLF